LPVISTVMSVALIFDLAEHLLHRRARADDLAEPVLLEPIVQSLVVDAQLVHQQRVRDDQRGLRREHRQHAQRVVLEQIADRVIADVDEPEQPAAIEQRHADHGRDLEVNDALARRELVIP
jgi:hypothetical protein